MLLLNKSVENWHLSHQLQVSSRGPRSMDFLFFILLCLHNNPFLYTASNTKKKTNEKVDFSCRPDSKSHINQPSSAPVMFTANKIRGGVKPWVGLPPIKLRNCSFFLFCAIGKFLFWPAVGRLLHVSYNWRIKFYATVCVIMFMYVSIYALYFMHSLKSCV